MRPNNANRLAAPRKSGVAILRRRLPTRLRPATERRLESRLLAAFALFLFCIGCAFPTLAAQDARQWFQAGRTAFEAQDYRGALAAFEQALAAQLSGPAIHYNIGVAAYKLGLYPRAEAAFLEVARTPAMTALAHYNLGLVALGRGDTAAATRWFKRIEHETTDERLRGLAATQLGAQPPPPERNWAAYAALNAGYDDNVALVSNSNVLGVSGVDDTFLEAQLAFAAPLGEPWQLDAGLVMLDYSELDDFDQFAGQGGARYRLTTGDWTNEIGAELVYTALDGEGFENRRVLALRTGTQLQPGLRLRARYRFSQMEGLNDFTGVGGHRHDATASLGWERGPWNLTGDYQFETSSLRDSSLSATRHQLSAVAERNFDDTWLLTVEIGQRHSRYDGGGHASEDRTEFGVAVSRTLNARWRVVLRGAYADNQSDLPQFNYHRTRITAGVEAIM